jgi:DNA-binding transcriptional LysR family regulator
MREFSRSGGGGARHSHETDDDKVMTVLEAHAPAIAGLSRRLDLTTLQLFVAVCEERNLTRAAARQAIAPSAASKRLNRLEQTLHVALFMRLPTGMALTAAGEALLHHARVMLLNVEKIAVELGEYAQGIRGHVRMLANLSAIVGFLPEDLPDFFRAHQLIRFDLQERLSTEVVRGVEDGAADIGICSPEVETRALETFPYRRDRLVIVARADHPLAGRQSLHFVDTLDFDHISLHAASSIYLRAQSIADQRGKTIRLRVHVPGFDAVCRMVQSGMGVGLIPDRAFEVLSTGMGLCAIPLLDPWAARQLKIVVRDVERLSTTSRLMFEHLRNAAHRHLGSEAGHVP